MSDINFGAFRDAALARRLIDSIHAIAGDRQINLMEVCGTHTVSIGRYGFRSIMPAGVHLHVLESIIVAQRAAGGRHSPQRQEEVMALLRQLGIAHLAMSYLDQLSGGQKQLVGLAQSLIRQPRLLLLDEPLSALDLNYQFHVMDLVRRETRRRNIVTLVVVHDINIALRHADHVLMLKAGQLLGDGTPAAVITPETLAAVYGVRGRIEPCSQGVRQVSIDGLVDSEA